MYAIGMTGSAMMLRDARAQAGVSQRALAEAAGVAQSTVARIERGTVSPTWEMLSRLLDTVGFAPAPTLEAAPLGVDMLAVGIDHLTAGTFDGAPARLRARLRAARAVGSDGRVIDPVAAVFVVAEQAPWFDRPGVTRYWCPDGVDAFVARLGEVPCTTILTGAHVAVAIAPITSTPYAMAYVGGNVDAAAAALRCEPADDRANVSLVPADDAVLRQSEPVGVIRWASPWRVAVDCAAAGGRKPALAVAVAERLAAGRP